MLWPRCSRFLFNTYRGFARLVLRGSDECLFSKEGVTQGDPLSMLIYAAALLPFVKSLKAKENRLQAWYADDSACIGNIKEGLISWLSKAQLMDTFLIPHSGSAVQIRVTINSRRQYTRRANSETWVGSHCFLGPYGRYLERGPYDQTVCKDTKYTQ